MLHSANDGQQTRSSTLYRVAPAGFLTPRYSCVHSLDIGDLFSVNSELLPVACRWRKIGLALRLDPDLLNRIRGNHTDVEDCLEDVVTNWLKKAYDVTRFGAPSWKLLVEAVAHQAGGNDRALAERIAGKYEGTCKI